MDNRLHQNRNIYIRRIPCFYNIVGFKQEIGGYLTKELQSPIIPPPMVPPLELQNTEDMNENMIMNLENRSGEDSDGLISLPLFRVTGTSMDIEKLVEKLQKNKQPLGGDVSYQQRPRAFGTQWKTRIG